MHRFTEPQQRALDWVRASVANRPRGRQPSLAVLRRLRDWGLIEFEVRTVARMRLVFNVEFTEEGARECLR